MGIMDDLRSKAQKQQVAKIQVPNGMDTNNPLSVLGIEEIKKPSSRQYAPEADIILNEVKSFGVNVFDDTAKQISERPFESVIEEVKQVLQEIVSTTYATSSLDELNKAHTKVHQCTILLTGYSWEQAGFWRDIVQSTMNALREMGANQIKGKLYVIK